jgi:hypothetical protein
MRGSSYKKEKYGKAESNIVKEPFTKTNIQISILLEKPTYIPNYPNIFKHDKGYHYSHNK